MKCSRKSYNGISIYLFFVVEFLKMYYNKKDTNKNLFEKCFLQDVCYNLWEIKIYCK